MARFSSRSGRRPWIRLLGLSAIAVLVASLVAAWTVPLPERLSTPGSTMVRYADGGTAHVFLSPDDRWRIPVHLDEVDPDYVAAVIEIEDARFHSHPGVDPVAVGRAVIQNLQAGTVVSGASTITMQVVRLAEPRPRTLRSKVIEAARAVQLELRLSKEEILSLYLDLVPYGANVEGIEAGSLALFGHSADHLTPAEICTLIAIPQDPNGRGPREANAARLTAARDDICARLAMRDALPGTEGGRERDTVLAEAAEQPVPVLLRRQPRDLPHAARWVSGGATPGSRIDTSFDRGVQALVERELAAVRAERQRQGVHNTAVVVVERETASLRALVGSFDFWEAEHGGQIPAFARPRSTGSTLKPFLAARAIDRGLLLPETLVVDVPTQFGAYTPENYDGTYTGMVSLEEALARSLNVPFVNLLADMGVEPFLGDLRALGASSLDPRPGHYGLSLAVGGAELSPLELATIYTALAEDGRARSLRWEAEPRDRDGVAVYSPGASFLVRETLRQRDRPDFPDRAQLARVPRRIAWKTGTSFGHRDAWAIGIGERYVVVVWFGNLDQTPSGHLVGATSAGPVLFDLLEGLGDGAEAAEPAPDELEPIQVCALSGKLPRSGCSHRVDALARQRKVPTDRCALHQRIEVDTATGERVGPGCRAGRDTESRVVVAWPGAVRRWLADRHRSLPEPPPLAAACTPPSTSQPPRIVSPAAGEVTLLMAGLAPSDQEIPLEADAGVSSGALSWFVDGVFLGAAAPHERMWWTPEPGLHRVTVLDERGASHQIDLTVRGGG